MCILLDITRPMYVLLIQCFISEIELGLHFLLHSLDRNSEYDPSILLLDYCVDISL